MRFDSCCKAPKSGTYDDHLDTRRRVIRNGRSHAVFPNMLDQWELCDVVRRGADVAVDA